MAVSIAELTEWVKKSSKERTPEQSRELLIKAHILTSDGSYDSRFFTKETVDKSKQNKAAKA